VIGRWQPLHVGQARVLEALAALPARHLVLVVGSSDRHEPRNPFTTSERIEMLRMALGEDARWRIVAVPDLDDGQRWTALLSGLVGAVDLLVTDNPYVRSLVATRCKVIRPVDLLPRDRWVAVDGTTVRRAMARGEAWRELVPPAVAELIKRRGLDDRFRREFGLATLALDAT
jgi:nicotinamide-nucleotide adenylyltransferase